MVDRGGFEPPTSAVRGRRSYQLIYRPIWFLLQRDFSIVNLEVSVFLFFSVSVLYSTMGSPVVFRVFFSVLTHAREVSLKVRFAEKDAWTERAFEMFCLDILRQVLAPRF